VKLLLGGVIPCCGGCAPYRRADAFCAGQLDCWLPLAEDGVDS
jgi:hypothetical protein